MRQCAKATTASQRRKAMGAHYTPSRLADYLADRLVAQIEYRSERPLRVLDPACGDGVLLQALLGALQSAGILRECEAVGVEAEPLVIPRASAALTAFEGVLSQVIPADFLDLSSRRTGQGELWESGAVRSDFDRTFDIIIANPPYVRTRVLGAEKAQRLAARYGLTGRVDLYHAFLVAATETLRPGGLMGIITSNRFLSTRGAAGIRRYLAAHYDIEEVIDLGDTKLFDAAVLPAIFIGRRRKESSPVRSRHVPRFLKVYSRHNSTTAEITAATPAASIYDVLSHGQPGSFQVQESIYSLARGDLVLGSDPSQVWCLTTAEEAQWLHRMRRASHGLFGDVARVRVGIKTTADEVFIQPCWESLPVECRPEPELLRDLLMHEEACRWSLPQCVKPSRRVLYPHEVSDGHRKPIDLRRYPRARSYLESHRKRLEKRHYVLDAGRKWYEIWVPQNPDAWAAPKIVFPDISLEPRFYLDFDGRVVNGDCYWMTLGEGVSPDMLYLLLAVANSSLMEKYYDLAFNNKLYSARRRYITQYVSKYPFPDPASASSQKLIAASRQLVCEAGRSADNELKDHPLATEIDRLVESAFGLRHAEVVK